MDTPTKDCPPSHDLYHAAVAAKVEMYPLISLIRSADISPKLKKNVIQSLARLEGQLGKAIARFKEEHGDELYRTSYENAMAVFGETITKEDHDFSSWRRCYLNCLKMRFGDDVQPPSDELIREQYDAGRTPLEAIS